MGEIADAVTKLIQRGARGAEIVALINRMEDGPAASIHQDFMRFWNLYPNRVGKGQAEKAWPKALKAAGSIEVLLDGVKRYAAKRDDRPWKNPATWLNGKCWEDQEPQPIAPTVGLAGVRARLMERVKNERPEFGNVGYDDAGGLPGLFGPHH